MRILYLSTSLGMGGADRQVLDLATTLKGQGHQVCLVSLTPLGKMGLEARAAGLDVASLNMRRGWPDPRALWSFARLARRWRPDVVHSNMVHANLLARVTRPLHRAPVLICTIHSVNDGGGWRPWAYRLTDGACDVTTQVSAVGADRYVRLGLVPKAKMLHVPNAVDTRLFAPDPEARRCRRVELGLADGTFVWLAVGRFTPAKDHATLLKAFAETGKAGSSTALLLAGEGPLEAEIRAEVGRMGLAHTVQFLGVRRDVPDLMNAADALVLSSAWEGMPIVVLEAAATGLPVVATDVGGVGQVVREGQNGYLVPPAEPDALAQAMTRLLQAPGELRREMGERARAIAEADFSLTHVAGEWQDLYARLLKDKRLTLCA